MECRGQGRGRNGTQVGQCLFSFSKCSCAEASVPVSWKIASDRIAPQEYSTKQMLSYDSLSRSELMIRTDTIFESQYLIPSTSPFTIRLPSSNSSSSLVSLSDVRLSLRSDLRHRLTFSLKSTFRLRLTLE